MSIDSCRKHIGGAGRWSHDSCVYATLVQEAARERETADIVIRSAGSRIVLVPGFAHPPKSVWRANTHTQRLSPCVLSSRSSPQVGITHYFRIDKARKLLGYAPLVSPEDGMRRTVTNWQVRQIFMFEPASWYFWVSAAVGLGLFYYMTLTVLATAPEWVQVCVSVICSPNLEVALGIFAAIGFRFHSEFHVAS